MGRPSSIDRLPPEIREAINRLRGKGHTIDEIMAKLNELDVVHISRSAVGRYIKVQAKVGERLRRTRVISEALIRERGDEPASRTARLNIELLHTAIFDVFGMLDGDGNEDAIADTLRSNPKAIHDLAKALDHLSRSARNDLDYERELEGQMRARIAAESEGRLKEAVKEKGLSAETAEIIRRKVLGLK